MTDKLTIFGKTLNQILMKLKTLILLIFSSLVSISFAHKHSPHEHTVAIIPQPVSQTLGKGEFTITHRTPLYCNKDAEKTALFLADFLHNATGYKLNVKVTNKPEKQTKGIVLFMLKAENTDREAYTLDVTPDRILMTASDKGGLFNAAQTLRQLLPPEIENKTITNGVTWNVPAISIQDKPFYKWRGYMKDVSRTFYNIDIVKRYLDVMALYKLNTFHFHLTDDQGWRIEIKQYPELTSEKATVFGSKHNEPGERSGFFTQEQIREIVAYAAERNIVVVPEIDVPGHCWPVILVYPELGVNNVREPDYLIPFLASWSYWGHQFTPNPLDPTKEEVYTFLDNVFTEVAELFPGEYIHFGGDEVVHRLWESEPHVQAFMKEKGFENVGQLQSYFVNRVAKIIIDKGKKPLGWSDILKDAKSLDKNVAIMSWLGDVKTAAANELYIVAAPCGFLYFDITQADRNDGTMSDLAYGQINSMERIYNYDPAASLPEEEKKYVLGVQANQWPAVPREVKDINVQNFPRLLALSEIAWLPLSERNYDNFMSRVDNHYPRLDIMKIDYYHKGGYITGTWSPKDLSTDFKPVEWDVTKKVYANGRAIAGFYYLTGDSYMKIRKVQLLENGKVISEDEHAGLADTSRATSRPKTYLYNLEVNNYNPEATYTIRAEVAGEKSSDSSGNFTFNLSPYVPFVVTEPH